MSSGFIAESELAEARKRRQEEWEKVRTADQPLERPEEPFDGRSLYDRLREQKLKKDLEYEETHKLKNLIRGLDDDEVQFLELVDQSKINAEKKQMLEEEKELNEFRNRVITLQEESIDKKLQTELKNTSKPKTLATAGSRPSQKALLGIGIKRKAQEPSESVKATTTTTCPKKVTMSNSKLGTTLAADAAAVPSNPPTSTTSEKAVTKQYPCIKTKEFNKGVLKCVAILPGIGPFHESSDSEVSTGSEDEPEVYGKYDLVGRKIKKKKICQDE